MKPSPISLGSLESELVRYVTDHPGQSGREIAESFAEGRSIARTTVLTVLERLRGKGVLSRRKSEGAYRYHAEVPAPQAIQGTVRRFVDSILGGSVSPVLAFLAESEELTDADIDELERLVRARRERA